MAEERTRIIYYGDNLDILRAHISTESVDLVYLDPPFKSQQDYNVLFRSARGEPATAQVHAFTDTWKWGAEARATYDQLMNDPLVPGKVSQMVGAFYQFLSPSEMLAYLVMMTPRLLELHRVLKETGSLYLHCDPAASHYLKLVLDTIFRPQNFRNEVVWKRSSAHSSANRFGPIHDILLFYTKTNAYTWNAQYLPYDQAYIEQFYRNVDKEGRRYRLSDLTAAGVRHGISGRPWHGINPTEKGRHWVAVHATLEKWDEEGRIVWPLKGQMPAFKRYLDEMPGMRLQDIVDDINPVQTHAKERLGYETQKPLGLLKRIIQASTNTGDLVLDPFCGCGTALVAAEELGRSWVGIDITYLAVDVMARRLRDHFQGISFEIEGQPKDEEGARALAEKGENGRFQFQVWALSQIGAQALDPDRKGADRGIDGYLPFLEGDRHQRAIVQVKSGRVGVKDIRDLRGTLEREKAPFALFITLEPPTAPMRQEAAEAGSYRFSFSATDEEIPKVQILTIRELLQGQKPRVPTTQVSPTPQAPRIRRARGRQLPLEKRPSD